MDLGARLEDELRGLIEALEEIDLATCIASSGSRQKMRLTLGLTGLWDRFEGARTFGSMALLGLG